MNADDIPTPETVGFTKLQRTTEEWTDFAISLERRLHVATEALKVIYLYKMRPSRSNLTAGKALATIAKMKGANE